jgi:hypothetical protein
VKIHTEVYWGYDTMHSNTVCYCPHLQDRRYLSWRWRQYVPRNAGTHLANYIWSVSKRPPPCNWYGHCGKVGNNAMCSASSVQLSLLYKQHISASLKLLFKTYDAHCIVICLPTVVMLYWNINYCIFLNLCFSSSATKEINILYHTVVKKNCFWQDFICLCRYITWIRT